jgi:DTW domain-containing protein YfiP
MSRRDNTRHRCGRCRMLGPLCVCALMPSPRLETRTRLVLVIHRFEDRKPTNTGRLAAECLANSEVVVRGHASQPTPPLSWDPGSTPLLLFPHDGATPLDALPGRAGSERPVTLIVPDGNWRQASKVRARVPGLRDVPCVSLPAGERSAYHLRAEAHETGLSTLEAIARAMDLLEGRSVRCALERVFRAMVERTLWSRGTVATSQVSGGIPEGALLRRGRPPLGDGVIR